MLVVKRNHLKQPFSWEKIRSVISKTFKSVNLKLTDIIWEEIKNELYFDQNEINVEEIQNQIEQTLFENNYAEAARSFILYREIHKNARFIRERIDYMKNYSDNSENAASSSETDANANVTLKNIANLEGEVFKTSNRIIQRQRMKDILYKLYPLEPELAKQYVKDLENHIIYTHDEASTPVLKPYCMAVTLYPLMTEGVGNIDGVTPTPPNDIQSFSGQLTNLVFLLSSQCKGAVAVGDALIALNYYVIKEYGDKWYNHLKDVITNDLCNKPKTIESEIRKGMKQFIYGVNQPAGNRSYNSPFTNLSYYDKYYFKSLFGDFYYPDGTQPEWKAIDTLQRIFMKLHRELRLIKPLTFPVTTMALVHDGKDCLDLEYKKLCSDEWAKGGSFFLYLSDNPTSLASCCRVLNEIEDNTFSSTTGMTGVMTGSCNVISLNLNRIIQDWAKWLCYEQGVNVDMNTFMQDSFNRKNVLENIYSESYGLKNYLIKILDRVYKYHIAYKTNLYDVEDKKMFAASNGNYIYLKKLYSTIGIIGYFEAAKFLGLKTDNNNEYIKFLQLILGTIKEQNKIHSIHDKKRPFLFNSEAIPGENLAVKLYKIDKQEGYWVPEDQNLYNSYFYNPWNNTSVLDKIHLHGEKVNKYTDGGQACHINLDDHLSNTQYSKLIDVAIKDKCNYFTFNIPFSECNDCGNVVHAPIKECPKCGSHNIDWWTRIIG